MTTSPVAAMADRELIERLRANAADWQKAWEEDDVTSPGYVAEEIAESYREAADRLEALSSEVERLTAELDMWRRGRYAALSGDAEHSIKSAGKR